LKEEKTTQGTHLGDALDDLTERGFLQPRSQDPVEPEPAYLQYVVTYMPGRSPKDDFAKLANVLEELKDYVGLNYLALTYMTLDHDYNQALACFERVIDIHSSYLAWLNKGTVLHNLGRYQEAAEDFDQSINLRSDLSESWLRKGLALKQLRLYQKALEAFDQAINLRPDIRPDSMSQTYPEAWLNKGKVLVALGRYQEGYRPWIES
jgi:tetratricopeptide (TPR) repeat protein